MDFWILNGVIEKTKRLSDAKRVGRTNLLHIVKQMFKELKVSYTDTCCPDTGYSSVRVNTSTNTLQKFDYTTKDWVHFTPGE